MHRKSIRFGLDILCRFEVEDGAYRQIVQEVVEEERPPMIEIEGYLPIGHPFPARNISSGR